MFEAKRWLAHFIRTLLTDYEGRLTSYTESFDANEVTLAHPAVSHITSVTVDSGANKDGYDWWFDTWGNTTTESVLKANDGIKITEVTYKTGQPYVVIGYPKWDTKFPVVSVDESFSRETGGLGVNSPTNASSDWIIYNFTVMLWGREGETYSGTTLTDHALIDELIETVTNGIQQLGTGSGNPLPYPFKDLNVTGGSKLVYEISMGTFHKDLTIVGKTKMDFVNSRW